MSVVASIRNELALLTFAFAPVRSLRGSGFAGKAYPYSEAAAETRMLALLLLVSFPPDVVIAHLFLHAFPAVMWTLDGLGTYFPIRAVAQLRSYRLRPHRQFDGSWMLQKGPRQFRIASADIISARPVARGAVRKARQSAHSDLTVGRENVVELSLNGTQTTRVLVSADQPSLLCAALTFNAGGLKTLLESAP